MKINYEGGGFEKGVVYGGYVKVTETKDLLVTDGRGQFIE